MSSSMRLSLGLYGLFLFSTLWAGETSPPPRPPLPPPQPPSVSASPASAPPASAAIQSSNSAALLNPALAKETAPAKFRVKFETTKGNFVVEVTREWAPKGADQFYNLVKIGYFKDLAFYRVIEEFMAQFGFHGDPAVNRAWKSVVIQDDPVKKSNTKGKISFAMRGPHTRSTQFFINFGDNSNLDEMGFAPFGEVIGDGMKVVKELYKEYGEGAPMGNGPAQGRLASEGNAYLKKDFPKLDYIIKATLEP